MPARNPVRIRNSHHYCEVDERTGTTGMAGKVFREDEAESGYLKRKRRHIFGMREWMSGSTDRGLLRKTHGV